MSKKSRPRLGPFSSALLVDEAYSTLSGRGRWLLHYQGCELAEVGGPYSTQKEFGDALVAYLKGGDYALDDTMHILSVDKDSGPYTTDFSNRFMEAARFLAGLANDWDGTKAQAKALVYAEG
jgi:hypothetical protein